MTPDERARLGRAMHEDMLATQIAGIIRRAESEGVGPDELAEVIARAVVAELWSLADRLLR